MREYRFNNNPLKQEYYKHTELKFTIENVDEFSKMVREIKKYMKNKSIDYIDFEVKFAYYLPAWFELKERFNKK